MVSCPNWTRSFGVHVDVTGELSEVFFAQGRTAALQASSLESRAQALSYYRFLPLELRQSGSTVMRSGNRLSEAESSASGLCAVAGFGFSFLLAGGSPPASARSLQSPPKFLPF